MSGLPAESPQRPGTSFVALPARDREHVVDLPQPLTSFIGRAEEIQAIVQRLRTPSVRMLTLTGPGGAGKTRLALAVANQLSDDFERVHFVPLTSTSDATLVPAAVARVVGIREAAGVAYAAALQDHIRDQPILLVLDNMEQVVPAGAFVAALLSRCPNLKVLVTSRITLRISGEHEYVVPTLALPDPATLTNPTEIERAEAVALFVERVRAFRPEFTLTDENAADIAEMCAQVDGLPLAIELAAARIRTFAPAALVRRFANRLELLTGGPRDLPLHQQTMRDTIAWSYDLLIPPQQSLFRRLSVFRGGISVAAAAITCSMSDVNMLEDLVALAGQSLLRTSLDAQGEPRFWMLVTLRDFGREQLDATGETDLIRNRHATTFLDLAERAAVEIQGPEQADWLDRLDQEQANVEAALEWLAAGNDVERFARLAAAMTGFWNIRGRYGEGRRWVELALSNIEAAPISEQVQASLLHGAGGLALGQGDRSQAISYAERSLSIARKSGDRFGVVQALNLLASLAYRATDYAQARILLDESLTISREVGAHVQSGIALYRRALVEMDDGLLDMAIAYFLEAREIFEQYGNDREIAATMDNMGVALYSQGKIEEAEELSIGALNTLRRFGDKRGIAVALGHVGKCASRSGAFERSWAIHQEALQIRLDLGDVRGLSVWLEAVAYLLAAAEQATAAANVMGATDAIREHAGIPLYGNELIEHDRALGEIRAAIADRAFAEAWESGRAKHVDEAIAYAVESAQAIFSGEIEASSPSTHPGERFGLTAREQEVLDLIAKRFSDKEIADALFISPRTVARHVSSIFDKLDVHARRDAAMFVEKRPE